MALGAFSVSLAVKDSGASRAFYGTLGFHVFGGNAAQHWLVMRNGAHTVGLFQGMFEKNIRTFNPGWDPAGKTLGAFTDVRDLERELKARGVIIRIPIIQLINLEGIFRFLIGIRIYFFSLRPWLIL